MTEMKRRILLLSALSLLQFVLVHFVLIQRFPNSGDEASYLFQAELFARNQLYIEDALYDQANPLNKYVQEDALVDVGGRRFSKYDPGWAALLSLGARLGVVCLVAPLLGALTVFLLLSHVSKRIGDEFVGATWCLVTLCSFFCFSVANYGSHTATMAFLFGAFFLYDNTFGDPQSKSSHWRLLSLGLILGYCSLIRYLDWVPLMGWIAFNLLRQRRIKGLILVLAGFGLVASCHLIYNRLLTGSAFLPPFAYAERANSSGSLGVSWMGFETTAIRLRRVLYAFPPAALILLCLIRPYRSARLKTYLLLFSLTVSTYFFYPWGVAGPGPRYFFPYFPFLILAVVEVYRLTRTQRIGQIGWSVAMSCLVVCSFVYGAGQTSDIYKRLDLERTVASIPQKKRIILLQSGTHKMDIPDLIRNPPDLWSADTLFFAYDDDDRLKELLARFPEHSVYAYEYPSELHPFP
jgi:hypothetical protein